MHPTLTSTLSPVNADDLEVLTSIARKTFVTTFGHLYSDQNLAGYIEERLSLEGITKEWSDPNTVFLLVRDASRKTVGYIKHIEQSQQYLEHLDAGIARPTQSLLLERFYFVPEAQGTGVAHKAMQEWLAFVEQDASLDAIHLSVWEENFRAQAFYQKYEFIYAGTFGYAVGDQTDTEFVYIKRLKNQ